MPCQEIVCKVRAWFIVRGDSSKRPALGTAAYCEARGTLSIRLLRAVFDTLREHLGRRAAATWLWCGRPVKVLDGTSFSMPDTAANQRQWLPTQRTAERLRLSGGKDARRVLSRHRRRARTRDLQMAQPRPEPLASAVPLATQKRRAGGRHRLLRLRLDGRTQSTRRGHRVSPASEAQQEHAPWQEAGPRRPAANLEQTHSNVRSTALGKGAHGTNCQRSSKCGSCGCALRKKASAPAACGSPPP